MEPEPAFYYHYKHDPSKDIYNYAYEVLNIGHHTEIDDFEAGEMVIYRPIYEEARVYKEGKHWDVRPRAMFLESKEVNGKSIPRFLKIEDSSVIELLEKHKNEMYPNS